MRAVAKLGLERQSSVCAEEVEESDQMAARQLLAGRVAEALRLRGVTQLAAANLLQIDQPKISRLLRGRFEQFSIHRLLKFLNLLGQDVEIMVHPAAPSTGQTLGRLRIVIGEGS